MSELLEAGLAVTATGMGVVFALLALLVGIIRGMSYLSALFEDRPAEQLLASTAHTTTASKEREIVGVISAAVAVYRKRRQQR